jgi:hypothetical protein
VSGQSVEDLDHGKLVIAQERVAAAKDVGASGAIGLGYYYWSSERLWPGVRGRSRYRGWSLERTSPGGLRLSRRPWNAARRRSLRRTWRLPRLGVVWPAGHGGRLPSRPLVIPALQAMATGHSADHRGRCSRGTVPRPRSTRGPWRSPRPV